MVSPLTDYQTYFPCNLKWELSILFNELIKILALQKKKRYNTMESDEKRVVISILFDREIRFGGTY